MSYRSLFAVAVLAAMLLAPLAQASVQYSAPYDPNSYNAWGSDTNIPQYGFADYYWDGSFSITDFHWWGVPLAGNGVIDGFTVEVWSHDASWAGPDQMLYSEYFGGDAGATFVETNSNFYHDVFKYGVDFSNPLTLPGAGYYWFSVYAHSTDSYWNWAWSAADDFNSNWIFAPPSTWFGVEEGNLEYAGFAFEITGGEVPEPTTLALFGVGLAGFAARRLRRKK
ncbi:MAG: PEP-CTERM sorting domain-containing protein [bacterium]